MARANLCGEHLAFLKQPLAVEEHVLGGAWDLPAIGLLTRGDFAANLQVFCR